MLRRIKFYFIGFAAGLVLVFLILNGKGSSCSYFPNDRVIAETLTKKFVYTQKFTTELKNLNISAAFVKDSVLSQGNIKFGESDAQRKPCPYYLIEYPKHNPKYLMHFNKCELTAEFLDIKRLK